MSNKAEDFPFHLFDYVGIKDPRVNTKDEEEIYQKSLKNLRECYQKILDSGCEILMVGIRDGKHVMINQHGEISTKTSYDEYMSKKKNEFEKIIKLTNEKYRRNS